MEGPQEHRIREHCTGTQPLSGRVQNFPQGSHWKPFSMMNCGGESGLKPRGLASQEVCLLQDRGQYVTEGGSL
jgi:hypothetical protein